MGARGMEIADAAIGRCALRVERRWVRRHVTFQSPMQPQVLDGLRVHRV